jgi:hypothetical protein
VDDREEDSPYSQEGTVDGSEEDDDDEEEIQGLGLEQEESGNAELEDTDADNDEEEGVRVNEMPRQSYRTKGQT